MTELLQQKLKQSQLLALKKELMLQKQQEALREQAALEPKLDLLLEKTKELQKLVRQGRRARPVAAERGPFVSASCPLCITVFQIEADISKRYNGRPVNLMGTCL